jgi:hypothetical protein
MIKRWTDAHVAVVVKPGGYEQVADDLEHALDEAGLEIERVKAPKTLEAPAKLLAKIGGSGVAGMVPDHLIVLRNPALEVLVYPSDISISGKKADLAAARAAVASRLTFTKAYLTSSKEPQQIEDRLERIATKNMGRSAAAVELEAIDVELSKIDIPYEEWEVLYRLRLQVERNLLATGAADEEAGPHEAANRTAQQQGQQAAQAATQAAVVAAAIPLILGLLDKRLSKTPLRPLVGLLRRAIP